MVVFIPLLRFREDDGLLEQDGVEDEDDKNPHWDWNVLFIVQLREAAGRRTKYLSQLLHLYIWRIRTLPIFKYMYLDS